MASSLPELLAGIAALDRDLAALQRVYDLICNPPKPPRRRRPAASQPPEPLVAREMVDVREGLLGVSPLWAFLEDVESDTAPRKPRKAKGAKAVEAVDQQPMKPLPMHSAPMPIKPPRVSPLERARRLGIGYEVYEGKKAKGKRKAARPVDPDSNAELAALERELARAAA